MGSVARADSTVSTTTTTTTTTTGTGTSTGATMAGPVGSELTYSTSGLVGTTGVSGTPVISLNPVQNVSVSPPNLSLGSFVVAPQPDGTMTTYNNTPFALSYATSSINGNNITDTQPLLTITGHLNGTVYGSNSSGVVATFDPIANPNINFGTFNGTQYVGSLALDKGQSTAGLYIVPANNTSGSTIQATIVNGYSPVPEPTTLAIFLAAGAGLGLRRRYKAKAAA